ncbi:hypothetical protein R3P38DRAFT_3051724 [Favolaschia claudopus]|uniref:Uncharacterized protein n=1 Tax=Favolaschia claudopus TaxID=2862362 RepID=A0AAW0A4R3_9AGAR
MSSSKKSASSSNSKEGPQTRSQIIKGFGGRPNFQYSYGLKMEPDEIEEGNAILDMLEQQEKADWEEQQQEQKKDQK